MRAARFVIIVVIYWCFKIMPDSDSPDAESNFIQNSEQYDVIFLIDNDVDGRQRPPGPARAHRGNNISAYDRDVLQSVTISDISI